MLLCFIKKKDDHIIGEVSHALGSNVGVLFRAQAWDAVNEYNDPYHV